MAGLIPFNKKELNLGRADFDDFNNMLDDFFSDAWFPSRDLLNDTFKIDIRETVREYIVEAELPGIKKEDIELRADGDILTIAVTREETSDIGYVHKERRTTPMSRSIRLSWAKINEIRAGLKEGVLTVNIPKQEKSWTSCKIYIC